MATKPFFIILACSELLFWCAEPRVPSPGSDEDQGGGIPRLQGKEYTEQFKNPIFTNADPAPPLNESHSYGCGQGCDA